jgi:hypothetical protein
MQVATWTPPTAIDNCGGQVNVTSNHNPGDLFPVGNTQVTYNFDDGHGNTSSCIFTVTVVDNTPPSFTNCPIDISTCSPIVTWTAPTPTDNCAGVTMQQTAGLPSGSVFPVGTTQIVYTATDAKGNQIPAPST